MTYRRGRFLFLCGHVLRVPVRLTVFDIIKNIVNGWLRFVVIAEQEDGFVWV